MSNSFTRFMQSSRSIRLDKLLITIPFYLLFLAQLAHHGNSRDEINAWSISYISQSIPDLLHRVHYEAHPALWYVILYAASHFSQSLWMLKLVEAIIVTGIYFLLAWASPFRRVELLLILSGYYLLFEYTVFCRMYSLELLFALAYAWFRTRRPNWVFRNTLWLGLMANVDITGAILAGALLLEYGFALLGQSTRTTKQKSRAILGSSLLFLAITAISIATLWPSKDIGWSTTGKLFGHFWEMGQLIQSSMKWIAIPWVPPAINLLYIGIWEPTSWPYFLLAPVVIIALCVIFRPFWRQGIILLAVIVTGTLFSQITSVGGVRHTGIVYIAFLVALWILRAQHARISPLTYLMLAFAVVPGIIGVIDQWSWPYTDAPAAAAWIQQQNLQDLPLFDTPDTTVLGVPERLHRTVYQLECNCQDRLLTFAKRRDAFNPATDVPPRLILGFHNLDIKLGLLLINRRLSPAELSQLKSGGLNAQMIAQFDRGFIDEYCYIYRITVIPSVWVPTPHPPQHSLPPPASVN